MGIYKLYDLAAVIRSKNSGPFQITLDVLFDDRSMYERIRDQGIITKEKIADLYKMEESRIREIVFSIRR